MPTELSESRESVYRHQTSNSSDNLKARAAHLVLDDDAQSILNQIFPPTEENSRGMTRRVVGTDEDPSGGASTSRRVLVIVPNLWTSLAKDFFNNPAWLQQLSSYYYSFYLYFLLSSICRRPVNELCKNESSLAHIDPSSPPAIPFTGSQLRALFFSLRTGYSLAYHHFQERTSLHTPLALTVVDPSEDFGGPGSVLLYVHLLYSSILSSSSTPSFLPCMRESHSHGHQSSDASSINLITGNKFARPSSGIASRSEGTVCTQYILSYSLSPALHLLPQ